MNYDCTKLPLTWEYIDSTKYGTNKHGDAWGYLAQRFLPLLADAAQNAVLS